MEKVIVSHKRTKVVYDEDKKIYTKYFYPKLNKKIKYFFKFRKYPGDNYNYITNILNTAEIRTAEILSYDKYSVTTREVKGRSLFEELMDSNKAEGKILIEKYTEIVSKIIRLGIYFGDFNFGNFIVSENEIYVIDLEDYRKDFFSKYRKKSLIKRLKRQLFERTEILGRMSEFYDGKEVLKKIEENVRGSN